MYHFFNRQQNFINTRQMVHQGSQNSIEVPNNSHFTPEEDHGRFVVFCVLHYLLQFKEKESAPYFIVVSSF